MEFFINLYDVSDDIINKLKDFIYYISTNELTRNI